MAMIRELSELVAEVRELANIEGMTVKWTDAKIKRRLNLAFADFREMISDHGHPYYFRQQSLTCSVPSSPTDIATVELTLPADCVRVYYLDLVEAGTYYPLAPLQPTERDSFYLQQLGKPTHYRIGNSNSAPSQGNINRGVRLFPRPAQAYTIYCWYLPAHVELSSDTDQIDGVQGWDKWILYETVCQILQAEGDTEQYQMADRERSLAKETVMEKRRRRQRDAPARMTGARKGSQWRSR